MEITRLQHLHTMTKASLKIYRSVQKRYPCLFAHLETKGISSASSVVGNMVIFRDVPIITLHSLDFKVACMELLENDLIVVANAQQFKKHGGVETPIWVPLSESLSNTLQGISIKR